MTVDAADVLVVDDSEVALETMLALFTEASIVAIGIPSAIGTTRAVLRYKIRVVVADVNMPGMTGNNLVALIRNNPKLASVKLVLVSGLPRQELSKLATECGADGIVAKDELDLMLVTTVKRLLSKSART